MHLAPLDAGMVRLCGHWVGAGWCGGCAAWWHRHWPADSGLDHGLGVTWDPQGRP